MQVQWDLDEADFYTVYKNTAWKANIQLVFLNNWKLY